MTFANTLRELRGRALSQNRLAELEQRDAARDARDLALYVFDADGRWVGRRESEAA